HAVFDGRFRLPHAAHVVGVEDAEVVGVIRCHAGHSGSPSGAGTPPAPSWEHAGNRLSRTFFASSTDRAIPANPPAFVVMSRNARCFGLTRPLAVLTSTWTYTATRCPTISGVMMMDRKPPRSGQPSKPETNRRACRISTSP